MVGQEEDDGRLEDTTEIDNAGEMILLEKAIELLPDLRFHIHSACADTHEQRQFLGLTPT